MLTAIIDTMATKSILLFEPLAREATGRLQSAAHLALQRISEAGKADTKSATPVEPDDRF
jgi:hypothetical protein